LTVAMGIRTFLLQPFKIPTGSMQPTLYGVTSTNLKLAPNFRFPTGWAAIRQWFAGVTYIHEVAEADGALDSVDPPFRILIFNLWQTLVVGGRSYTIWFPPDYGNESLDKRAGIYLGQFFHKGEDILKLRVHAGDHLFVDRLTYNFRPPQRGEIIVFETRGIQGLPQDQFYIKRLVGLGGEALSLGEDHEVKGVPGLGTVPVGHLVVNGQPLSASTRHFENLYSYSGAPPGKKVLTYEANHYYGHAVIGNLAPGSQFQVGTNDFFVMGDNTMNSLDSRYWGDFPQTQCIGKAFFIYWPITDRFGWGYR
jgi:signal peptidase I